MKNKMTRQVDVLGRIVLPKSAREHYGIHENDTVEIEETAEGILIKKAPTKNAIKQLNNKTTP